MNEALAANTVSMAQSGVDATSFASLSLASARKASLAEGQEDLSFKLREAALQRKSKNIGAIRDAQMASTLLSAGTQYFALKGPSGETPPSE